MTRIKSTRDPAAMLAEMARHYTSTELLSIVGCTRKTLRVFEQHRLLRPARSTGQRRYSAANLRRLWLIKMLRDLDFPIAQIKAIVTLRDHAPDAGPAAIALGGTIDRIIKRIDAKTRDLQIAREALVAARDTMDDCSVCERATDACRACALSGRLDSVSQVLLGGLGAEGPARVALPVLTDDELEDDAGAAADAAADDAAADDDEGDAAGQA